VTATERVVALDMGHAERKRANRLAHYAPLEILIVDELGHLRVDDPAPHAVSQLDDRRRDAGPPARPQPEDAVQDDCDRVREERLAGRSSPPTALRWFGRYDTDSRKRRVKISGASGVGFAGA
jgi:hypothetical protein